MNTRTAHLLAIILAGQLVAGCATLTKDVSQVPDTASTGQPAAEPQEAVVAQVKAEIPPAAGEPAGQEAEVPEAQKGILFAKSVFEGVLKANYVQLHFKGTGENTHEFDLVIGEKGGQLALPWGAKAVEPGYFYVELPAGSYKITSIAIPVGSTLAQEAIDIDVIVKPLEITYAGTLKVVGTKEKIKLGGVPVIRPGFEYNAQVIDEREDGLKTFRSLYPQFNQNFQVELLRIHPLDDPLSKP